MGPYEDGELTLRMEALREADRERERERRQEKEKEDRIQRLRYDEERRREYERQFPQHGSYPSNRAPYQKPIDDGSIRYTFTVPSSPQGNFFLYLDLCRFRLLWYNKANWLVH